MESVTPPPQPDSPSDIMIVNDVITPSDSNSRQPPRGSIMLFLLDVIRARRARAVPPPWCSSVSAAGPGQRGLTAPRP